MMNTKDLIVEFILYVFDGVMDVITLGGWSRWRGNAVPNVKVRASTTPPSTAAPLSEEVK